MATVVILHKKIKIKKKKGGKHQIKTDSHDPKEQYAPSILSFLAMNIM